MTEARYHGKNRVHSLTPNQERVIKSHSSDFGTGILTFQELKEKLVLADSEMKVSEYLEISSEEDDLFLGRVIDSNKKMASKFIYFNYFKNTI